MQGSNGAAMTGFFVFHFHIHPKFQIFKNQDKASFSEFDFSVLFTRNTIKSMSNYVET